MEGEQMKKLSGLALVLAASMGNAAYGAPPTQVASARPVTHVNPASAAAEALSRGDTLEALTRADEAVRADPKSAWAHYNRAAALAAMKRIDEAVAAYDEAAAKFAAGDKRGKSLALWGKAHALYRVGRCSEASQAFGEYAKVIGSSDPQSTALASERATTCHPAAGESDTASVATTPKPSAETKTSSMPSLAKP
jgi:tetratricopeptide (TPR) repeat protein